ncbi:hypothetical protein M2372_003987 [Chryseobacterium sp. BIGb0232]|nr:hypothetical protein [Chryseobacterium sp. BIGb0232]ROS14352.1 hypothetical protein EDF65_3126 [Chryseobacterium nakagawai]
MWVHGVNGAGEKEKKLQKKLKNNPELGFNDTEKDANNDILFIFSILILLFIQLQ